MFKAIATHRITGSTISTKWYNSYKQAYQAMQKRLPAPPSGEVRISYTIEMHHKSNDGTITKGV